MRRTVPILLVLLLLAWAAPVTSAQSSVASVLMGNRMLPGEYEDQVTALFSQHRWAKGKELLDQALELYPDQPNLQYLCGRYWWNAKNYNKARYHLVKACTLQYNHTEAKTLLINVEEITGNYSSAICYVNELLEVNPYWKGLWLRKVGLYKKQGNFDEANALLTRLEQIYPNDASISSDRYEILESSYQQARRAGDLAAAEQALEQMVKLNPYDPDYQLAYTNILIQNGRLNDALDNLTAALNFNPGNVPIIRKTTDILMETGRNMGALALVRGQLAQHPSAELQALYNRLLEVSARMENEADVYHLYTRVYAQNHSMESLQYLLGESMRRGYYDDALLYIDEMRKRVGGDNPRLAMTEYDVLQRMGHEDGANKVLERSFSRYPGVYDINLAYCRMQMAVAASLMADGSYGQAIAPLETVRRRCVEEELRHSAIRRLALCYREIGDYGKAAACLKERMRFDPAARVSQEYASLLAKENKPLDALAVLSESLEEPRDSVSRKLLVAAYEEIAIPYIRTAMEQGAQPRALSVSESLLKWSPANYWALRYACSAAQEPEPYVDAGLEAYPEDAWFLRRKAMLVSDHGDHETALVSLKALLKEYPADGELKKSTAAVAARQGERLRKEKKWDAAGAVLDSALVLTPADADLRFARGLVYEKQRQWDSAYVYQSAYKPSEVERAAFVSRMRALKNRSFHNSASAGYEWFRRTDGTSLTGIFRASYRHSWAKDAVSGSIGYTGRDASWDSESETYTSAGGRGLQFRLQYSHNFNSKLSLSAGAGYATAYFSKWSAEAAATLHLPKSWELEAGVQYRMLRDQGHLVGVPVSVAHSMEHFYLGGKVTLGSMHSRFYANGLLKARFFPYAGGRHFVELQGGGGTAPELDYIDSYYTGGVYNKFNTFVALSGNWLATENLALSGGLTWNTLYGQYGTVRYTNMMIVHVQITVSF